MLILDTELGVDIFSGEDLTVSVNAQGRFSDNTESYGGNLRISLRF